MCEEFVKKYSIEFFDIRVQVTNRIRIVETGKESKPDCLESENSFIYYFIKMQR